MTETETETETENKLFTDYVARQRDRYGPQFDSSDLAPDFIPHFRTGQRLRVDLGHGLIKSGTIGVTTGWHPAFLLLLTTRSTGSAYVLSPLDKILNLVPSPKFRARTRRTL